MWLNLLLIVASSFGAELCKGRLRIRHTLTVSFLGGLFMCVQLLILAVVFDIAPRNMRGRSMPLGEATRGVLVAGGILALLFLVSYAAEWALNRRKVSEPRIPNPEFRDR